MQARSEFFQFNDIIFWFLRDTSLNYFSTSSQYNSDYCDCYVITVISIDHNLLQRRRSIVFLLKISTNFLNNNRKYNQKWSDLGFILRESNMIFFDEYYIILRQ